MALHFSRNLYFIEILNYVLLATQKLLSHKFLVSQSNSVVCTVFATLLCYYINSTGKKIFVPLMIGQDWKSAVSTGGDV